MALHPVQTLINYRGQYHPPTPNIQTMRTTRQRPDSNVPGNFYNYHNSLFKASNEQIRRVDDDITESGRFGDDNKSGARHKNIGRRLTTSKRDEVFRPRAVEADHGNHNYYNYNDLDEKISNIQTNEEIFRQGGNDLSSIANYALSAMKMLSLIFSVVGGTGSESSNQERVDVGLDDAPTSDIDVALGTLMAFGGKYLRSIAMYAWEHATQTPAEPLGAVSASASPVATSQAQAQEAVVAEPEQPQSVASPAAVPYLSTLTTQQLDELGLKAVNAGAEPAKLQQAFAAAQLNHDWSLLEKEMAAVLGPDAVNGVSASSGTNMFAQAANLIQSFVASPSAGPTSSVSSPETVISPVTTSSVVPSGLGYYVAVANNYADKLNKVINGPDPSIPDYNLSEEDKIGQQSIVTRFIKEFHLEQEAMALQYQANTIIKQVNSFIDGTPTEKVDNYGENVGEQDIVGGGGSSDPIGQMISSIPNMISQAAVSVMKFISPVSSQQIQEKGSTSSSQVSPSVDFAYAALGAGAIGTVLYSIYAANEEDRRRSLKFKRSVYDINSSPYAQLPYPLLQPRQASASSNSTSDEKPHGSTNNHPTKPNPNGKIDNILSTALGLGVGGIIFYGVFLGGKRRRRSASPVQQSEQILFDSIRKYSDTGSTR